MKTDADKKPATGAGRGQNGRPDSTLPVHKFVADSPEGCRSVRGRRRGSEPLNARNAPETAARFGLQNDIPTAKPRHHMSTGRNNKLAGQIGEFLVCAELGKRGLIATPFSGNVPAFDILAADDLCNTVPIQVKASRGALIHALGGHRPASQR